MNKKRIKVVVLLILSLGLFWFSEAFSPAKIFEPQGTAWNLWVGYARDLILPFALYFFLCIGETWLKTWRARALIAFAVPALIEVGQLLYQRVGSGGPYYVGSFDPFDFLAYAVGIGLAILIERQVFARCCDFW